MDGFTHITDRLISKLIMLPSVRGLSEEIKKRGRRVPDGYEIKVSDWEDLRRDYGLAPSRGFGDTFAKVTKAFGVKPCGKCNKRRKRLNALIKYK